MIGPRNLLILISKVIMKIMVEKKVPKALTFSSVNEKAI
jgi:hypothetical protein